jgi:hypothetical protein
MAFPTSQINTTNLDSDADSPASARVDLLALTVAVNTMIAEANAANGVALLDGSGTIASTAVPAIQQPFGVMTLDPSSSVVKIEDILRMESKTAAQLLAFATSPGNAAGDVAYCSDGDAGEACLAVYNGTNWRVVRLMTQIGNPSAAFTVTSTLTATADA